jgi:hypothetical protein
MKTATRTILLALFPLLLAGVGACAGAKSAARVHPEKVQGPPRCSSCHETNLQRFDHEIDFVGTHRALAVQDQQVCEVCHQPSFCADCHGTKEELKPSGKLGERPGNGAPHRGDYLTQHRIDGRINPAPCFGCHGRKNEWRCQECHR